jgi:hypothetical protein
MIRPAPGAGGLSDIHSNIRCIKYTLTDALAKFWQSFTLESVPIIKFYHGVNRAETRE